MEVMLNRILTLSRQEPLAEGRFLCCGHNLFYSKSSINSMQNKVFSLHYTFNYL
uniref:Uncharacterized protein n=1 Tax=Anguilla anguilla TaxID=7936 RepID=A0A0E9V3U1_ANGAN